MGLKIYFRVFLSAALLLAEYAHGSTTVRLMVGNDNESTTAKFCANNTEFTTGNLNSANGSSGVSNVIRSNADILLDSQAMVVSPFESASGSGAEFQENDALAHVNPDKKTNSIYKTATKNSPHREVDQLAPVGSAVKTKNAVNQFARTLNNYIFPPSPGTIITEMSNGSKTQDLSNLETRVWSPFSVYQALVPLYHAADGKTRMELGDILSLASASISSKPQQPFELASTPVTTEDFESITGVFVRNDMPLNSEYVEQVEKQVKNVKIEAIDFSENPAVVVNHINTWASKSTHGLINAAIDETQVNPNTFMIIANCVRFKAPWKTQFSTKLTKVANFYGIQEVRQVQMMKQIGAKRYAKFPITYYSNHIDEVDGHIQGDNALDTPPPFSVLEMPYADSDLVSLFILPETTAKLRETLDYVEKWGVEAVREKLGYVDVEVLMPKFRINSDTKVDEALAKSGFKSLFNPLTANLTRLVKPRYQHTSSNSSSIHGVAVPPYVDKILHRTIFETTEEGTSAAAITAVSIVPLSALSNDHVYRFNLNRPFIIFLLSNDNIVLFQGVIADLIGQNLGHIPDGPMISTNKADKNFNSTIHLEERVTSDPHHPNRNSFVTKTAENNSFRIDNDKTIVNYNEDNPSSKETNTSSNDPLNSTREIQQQNKANATNLGVRSWWMPQRIPEYLLPAATNSNVSQTPNDEEGNASHKRASSFLSPVPAIESTTKETVNEFIQFSKYQQPEPKDPNGIRFPATIPQTRNKVNIKPRYEVNEGERWKGEWDSNLLTRWMNVY